MTDAGHTVAVAFSGGRDSLALLHATCRAAAAMGLQVVALHVHHGLMPEADAWLAGAQRRVAAWRRRGWPVTLRWVRLDGAPAPGDSVEAWARAGRRAALARMAQEAGASLLLLAHHRRDQAETVLLQLLRGGGAAGLAAMPRRMVRDGVTWARPWLDQRREAIEAYGRRHRLLPVDDPSNADPRFARNRLRHAVWPALTAAFADAEVALAAAARRAQQAAEAIDDWALAELSGPPAGCTADDGGLHVGRWRALPAARQPEVLRRWLRQASGQGVMQSLVSRLGDELPGGARPVRGAGQWPAGGGAVLTLYRGVLRHVPAASAAGGIGPVMVLDLSRPGTVAVPTWRGAFIVGACADGGLPAAQLRAVQLRPRQGGEQFQAMPGAMPRSLKKQYQARGLPAHARDGPLVWAGDRLLYVPGLGIDARAVAGASVPALDLRWLPQPDPEHPAG